jgi:DNA-binding NarL/FixJ family response regulator
MNQSTLPLLTEREKRVLKLTATGLTNKEIAQSLGIVPRTVEFHLSKIFKKLNVTCRAAASVAAEKMGLLNE